MVPIVVTTDSRGKARDRTDMEQTRVVSAWMPQSRAT